jgi:hypothetical protein
MVCIVDMSESRCFASSLHRACMYPEEVGADLECMILQTALDPASVDEPLLKRISPPGLS